ncbi:MAG: hypothetical protein LBK82_00810 [Planctomycetaceae bacterium]|nr:hypothetical protein [Planctomycetaceae bacterium]
MVSINKCRYRKDIEPEELYHELRPCKKMAVYCCHPDTQITMPDGSVKLLRVASVDCTAVSCALFVSLDN